MFVIPLRELKYHNQVFHYCFQLLDYCRERTKNHEAMWSVFFVVLSLAGRSRITCISLKKRGPGAKWITLYNIS